MSTSPRVIKLRGRRIPNEGFQREPVAPFGQGRGQCPAREATFTVASSHKQRGQIRVFHYLRLHQALRSFTSKQVASKFTITSEPSARLLDIYLDGIGWLAIHRQHQIHFAPSDQTARHFHIDLIQAREITLRSGIIDCGWDAADGGYDIC